MAETVGEAEARVAEARARLNGTLGELQDRLNPRTLMRDATDTIVGSADKAARVGLDTVRENPGKIAGGIALVAALLARRRIIGAAKRITRSRCD